MKLALAAHHHPDGTQVAAVSFDDWTDVEAARTFVSRGATPDKPARGEVDLRALPGMLALLGERSLSPTLIVIDGFVHVDAQETPGFGWHLHRALGGRVPIVGVSKNAAPGLPPQFDVHREEETRPLVITSVGVDLGSAKAWLRAMHGRKRVPTLLKLATRLAKNSDD